MYTMVEIPQGGLGPAARRSKGPWDVALVPKPAAEQLAKKGYIPGLINSNDAAPEAKSWSGWSASGEVTGADGKVRRWVYLHYFKPTQPALNWLDPSLRRPPGRRRRTWSATCVDRKTRVLRLDAVPFLGIEPKPGDDRDAALQAPAVGGRDERHWRCWSASSAGGRFHELNVPLEDLKKFTANGPDLSYDFVTRAQMPARPADRRRRPAAAVVPVDAGGRGAAGRRSSTTCRTTTRSPTSWSSRRTARTRRSRSAGGS